jgi:hypothetical protein
MILDDLVPYAPILTASAVSLSLIVGISQIIHMNRRQRQQTARAIFSEFIKTSIDHPIFAYPPRFSEKFNFDNQEINGSKETFEQYEWYISALCIACREVLETLWFDEYWTHRVRRNLRYHVMYFAWREGRQKPEDFIFNSGKRMQKEISFLIKEYRKSISTKTEPQSSPGILSPALPVTHA